MAGSINSGYNLNAASVPVSKYIQNATHVGVAQNTGKEATRVETDSAPEVTARPTPAPQTELRGMRREVAEDNSSRFIADSGLATALNAEGQITGVDIPGEGQIQVGEQSISLQTPDGREVPVQPFLDQAGGLGGFTYSRADKTEVYVDLQEMKVGFMSKDKDVLQELDREGGQTIMTQSEFRGAKGSTTVKTHVHISPEGEITNLGEHREGLKVSAGKIEFRNPGNNFPVKYELPVPVSSLPSEPAPARTGASPAPQGPLREEPPSKPQVSVELPGGNLFHRDPNGQTMIQLRTGLTLLHFGTGRCEVKDLRSGAILPAQAQNYTSADGRVEKTYRFNDPAGNRYQMFNESMDFLVESADGRVRQHVMPDGSVLGAIRGEDGRQYRFEVTPRGRYKTDAGLMMAASPSNQDVSQAGIPGPNGQTIAVNLPYPIPGTQPNAAYMSDIVGEVSYPLSGEKIPGFEQTPAPGPTPPPLPPEPTILPQAGQPQRPVEPNFADRLKYLFSNDSSDLQPQAQQPMTGQPQPSWGGVPTGPQNPFMGMGPVGSAPPVNGYNPVAGSNVLNPGNPNPAPSYPGSYPAPGSPNWTGQLPSAPGVMPNMDNYINRMRYEFEMNNAMMWGQVMNNGRSVAMSGMMQGMSSAMFGLSMNMAMMPRNMFFSPFGFF